MISVLQRVARASVTVDDEIVGQIGAGLLVLVCAVNGDADDDVAFTASKLPHLRVFADEDGKMNRSVVDVGGDLLLVSQFTLAADTSRGRRPSFGNAAAPHEARRLFDALVGALRAVPLNVQTGEFGASMQVESVNDGPVTLMLDSHRRHGGGGQPEG